MSITYNGKTLLEKLRITTGTVKVRHCDCSPVRISIERAIALVRLGNYTGSGTQSRVSTISEIPPAHPRGVRLECWRNQEAAVLPPGPDWLRAHSGYRSKVSRLTDVR